MFTYLLLPNGCFSTDSKRKAAEENRLLSFILNCSAGMMGSAWVTPLAAQKAACFSHTNKARLHAARRPLSKLGPTDPAFPSEGTPAALHGQINSKHLQGTALQGWLLNQQLKKQIGFALSQKKKLIPDCRFCLKYKKVCLIGLAG